MHARGITVAEALLEIIHRANDDDTRLPVTTHNIVNDFADKPNGSRLRNPRQHDRRWFVGHCGRRLDMGATLSFRPGPQARNSRIPSRRTCG
jgi:hypothetical protein